MTHKQIDASREARLWIGQVIVPAITGGIMLYTNPNVRNWVGGKVNDVKRFINSKKIKKS